MDLYAMALLWRERLLKRDAAALAAIARAYEPVYLGLRREMESALKDVAKRPESAAYRVTRLRELERQIAEELAKYGVSAGERITTEQAEALTLAAASQAEMIEAQVPRVAASLTKFPTAAMTALAGFASDGTPLSALLASMAPEHGTAVRDRLLQGLALGHGPDKIAAAFRDEMGVPLTRALRVARTETMRAYREGSRLYAQENAAGIVTGWYWLAGKDTRCCSVCWAMDGTWHPIEEEFATHPNCRCTAVYVPDTIPGAPAPWKPAETGEEAFAKLPEKRQLDVLGPGKYELYRNGEIRLSDLVKEGRDARWGAYRVERPLKDLQVAGGTVRATSSGGSGGAGAPPGGRMGTGDEDTPDRLIEDFAAGRRDLTDGEVERVVRHVAEAGFSAAPTVPVRSRLDGVLVEERVLRKGDLIDNGLAHFVRHVVDRQEWPVGTRFSEYEHSLRQVVLDPRSGWFTSAAMGLVQLTVVGRDVVDGRWVVVGYNPGYGYWVTGYKPADKLKDLKKPERRPGRWMRKPRW